ncbi:MAG: cell division protein ZapB [Spirochaetaceae bacterium]|jgi:FtsZ-binding cell division protein ZapB|nr:cell division protein ZapB [Spirochaetaceae bacterium]
MVTIEQVELLESKVSKAIEYVKRLTAENKRLKETSTRLVSENDVLSGKLDGYQKRIAELEVILQGFKRDQERIDRGIISAIERLNLFEDMVGETVAGDGASIGTVVDGGAEREEPSGAVPLPASAVPPPVTTPSIAASAGIPAASAFPGPVPFEPASASPVEDEEIADGAYGVAGLSELSEMEADNDAGPETSDETSRETETDANEQDGLSEDDEDEFLDALKHNRPPGLGQAAAAFHENAGQSSENLLEKPANGLELDIF